MERNKKILASLYPARTYEYSLCGKGDSNPHAYVAPPPQDGASTNSAISAQELSYKFKLLRQTHKIFFFTIVIAVAEFIWKLEKLNVILLS